MKIGYIRISSNDQNIARQEKIMEDIKIDELFIDKMSGSTKNRPELIKMLDFIRKGDTIIVESISRIARNTRHLLELIDVFKGKGVEFISIKENIDTNTPTGKFMLTVFGAVAELEREAIRLRQREGIEIAKKNMKYKGRKKIEHKNFEKVYRDWKEKKITAIKAMNLLDMKKNTFYRRVLEFESKDII